LAGLLLAPIFGALLQIRSILSKCTYCVLILENSGKFKGYLLPLEKIGAAILKVNI
jgi:hypothetical protein